MKKKARKGLKSLGAFPARHFRKSLSINPTEVQSMLGKWIKDRRIMSEG
jgi:hypothetical protein